MYLIGPSGGAIALHAQATSVHPNLESRWLLVKHPVCLWLFYCYRTYFIITIGLQVKEEDKPKEKEVEQMSVDGEEEPLKSELTKTDVILEREVKSEPEEMSVDEPEQSKTRTEEETTNEETKKEAEEKPEDALPIPSSEGEVKSDEKNSETVVEKKSDKIVAETSVPVKKENVNSSTSALESVDKLKALFPELEVMHKGTDTEIPTPAAAPIEKQNKSIQLEKTFAQLIAQSYQHPIKWPKVGVKFEWAYPMANAKKTSKILSRGFSKLLKFYVQFS